MRAALRVAAALFAGIVGEAVGVVRTHESLVSASDVAHRCAERHPQRLVVRAQVIARVFPCRPAAGARIAGTVLAPARPGSSGRGGVRVQVVLQLVPGGGEVGVVDVGWSTLAPAAAGGGAGVTAEHRPQQVAEAVEEPVHGVILPNRPRRPKAGVAGAIAARDRGAGGPAPALRSGRGAAGRRRARCRPPTAPGRSARSPRRGWAGRDWSPRSTIPAW